MFALVLVGCTTAPAEGPTADSTTPAPGAAPTTTAPTPTTEATPADSGETVDAIAVRVLLDRQRLVEVTLSVDGDWRVDDPHGPTALAFDAVGGTLHMEVSGERHLHVGLASSGPDSPISLLDPYLPLVTVSGGLDKLATGTAGEGWWDGGPTVDFADHFRRPTLAPGSFGDAVTDHVWVSLDASTLIPVSVTHASDQRPVEVTVRRWEVVEITIAAVDRARFRLWDGPAVEPTEHGFTAIGLAEADTRLGYEPPHPSWLPDGFLPTSVEVADSPLLWWSYPSLPRSERVAVLTYRRGAIETLTVTVRDATTGDWQDPYHRGDMDLTGAPHVTPGGLTFSVVAGPWPFWPVTHAWAITGGLVITVGGDITVDELRRILDGLDVAG